MGQQSRDPVPVSATVQVGEVQSARPQANQGAGLQQDYVATLGVAFR